MQRSLMLMLVGALLLSSVAPAAAQTNYSRPYVSSRTFTGSIGGEAGDWVVHRFAARSPELIAAQLSWTGNADLNLFLRNPGGEFVAMSTTANENPESIRYRGAWEGLWTLGIKARHGTADYALALDLGGNAEETQYQGYEAAGNGWQAHAFEAQVGDHLEISLRWPGDADLNLFLKAPSGSLVASAATRTDNPEVLSYEVDEQGEWVVAVNARSGGSSYVLSVGVEPAEPPGQASTAPPAPHPGPGVWALAQENAYATYTRSQAIAAAETFDVITAWDFTFDEHVPVMRQANPQLILGAYLNGVFAQAFQENGYPESWYLHDAQGNKIENNWGLWMMDPAHPGWVADRVAACAESIRRSGYDGCFVDNLGTGTLWPPTLTGQPINPRTGAQWTHQEWLTATSEMARRMRESVDPALVMVNGLVSGFQFRNPRGETSMLLDSAHYGLAETFLRTARANPYDAGRSLAAWRADVDMLVDAGNDGHHVMTMTKIWNSNATEADIQRWHEFALGSFLLGDNGNHYFGFSDNPQGNRLAGHDAWDVDLGAAAGPYGERDGVFSRDFARGRVIVNPSAQSRQVPLDGTYRRLGGQTVSGSIVVGPWSAAILTR